VLAALTVALVGLSFTGGGIWTLILVLSDEAFGLGTEGSGFLNSVYGVGGVVGGLAAGYLASKVRLGPAVIWSIGAGSVVFICLGISPAGVLPFVIMFVVGILDIMVEVNSTTIIQTGTPEELLGRVFGAFDGVLILAMLAGAHRRPAHRPARAANDYGCLHAGSPRHLPPLPAASEKT
jgi:MFS family permease